MARITNKDCLEKLSNRFDLILIAGHRTRQIIGGAALTIPRNNDKPTVLSLREIAQGTVGPSELKESFVVHLRKQYGFFEETEEELENMLALDISEGHEDMVLDESDLAELENSNFEIREIGDDEDDDEDFAGGSGLIGEDDDE